MKEGMSVDDDVGLHVLGCRVDILGTNCNRVWIHSEVPFSLDVCLCEKA